MTQTQIAQDRATEMLESAENVAHFNADTKRNIDGKVPKMKVIYKKAMLLGSEINEIWRAGKNDLIVPGETNLHDATMAVGKNAMVYGIDLGVISTDDPAAKPIDYKSAVYRKFGKIDVAELAPLLAGEIDFKIGKNKTITIPGTMLLPESVDNTVIQDGILFLPEPIPFYENESLEVRINTPVPVGKDKVAASIGLHSMILE